MLVVYFRQNTFEIRKLGTSTPTQRSQKILRNTFLLHNLINESLITIEVRSPRVGRLDGTFRRHGDEDSQLPTVSYEPVSS